MPNKTLHFNQGPLLGQNVAVDLPQDQIDSLLATGYCTEVPAAPVAAPVVVEVKAAAPVDEPKEEPKEEPKKPARKRRRRKQPETPEA